MSAKLTELYEHYKSHAYNVCDFMSKIKYHKINVQSTHLNYNTYAWNLFIYAALDGDVDLVKALLSSSKVDINHMWTRNHVHNLLIPKKGNMSILQAACSKNHEKLVFE